MSMLIDGVIALVLCVSALVGFSRGLIHELLSLLVWGIAILFIFIFSDNLSLEMKNWIIDPQVRFAVAATLLFLPTFLLLSRIKRELERVFLRGGPDSHDNFFGFIFGGFRGLIIISTAILVGSAAGLKDRQWWFESWLITTIDQVAQQAVPLLPTGLQTLIQNHRKPLRTHRLVLNLDRNGHYQAKGLINGKPVEFLLDPGASVVSVPSRLGTTLGLAFGDDETLMTATGKIDAKQTLIDRIQIGNIVLTEVKGAILANMPDDRVLLGMSFLKRLNFQKSGYTLILEQQMAH